MKQLLPALFVCSVVLLGAGCTTSSSVTTTEPAQNTPVTTYSSAKLSCPEKMVGYRDGATGLQFCYPEGKHVEQRENEYLIGDEYSSGLKDPFQSGYFKDIAIVPVPASADGAISSFIETKFANQNLKGFICEVMTGDVVDHGVMYTIIGMTDDEVRDQTLEATDACRSSAASEALLSELPLESFYVPTGAEGYMIAINGSQEPLLGEYEEAFINSLSVQK